MSTITGKVGPGLVHSGDIRFFLMPVPPDAGVIGAADGKPLTKDDVAARYSNSGEALKELNQLGYKDGAYRDYQTGDAKYHVVARLWHFASAQSAKLWVQGEQPSPAAKAFSVSGFPDVRAWYISPPLSGDPASVRGMGVCGDVAFEIYVIGQEPLDRGLLADRVRKQVDRLTKGA